MGNYVITISREYGSGGRDIGKKLAEMLNIPFYDREIVELTARKHDLDEARLLEMEEQSKTALRFGFGDAGSFADSDDRLFILQSQTVIELAQQPCVIVGRCADFVLRDHPGRYSFFIYSGLKQRMAHMKKQAGVYRTGDPAPETAKMDRRRAAYYKYHTGQECGARQLCPAGRKREGRVAGMNETQARPLTETAAPRLSVGTRLAYGCGDTACVISYSA